MEDQERRRGQFHMPYDELQIPTSIRRLEQEVLTRELYTHDVNEDDDATDENRLLKMLALGQKILIEESRRRERRQFRFEERVLLELDGLRRQLRQQSTCQLSCFPQFTRFPPEIRDKIWAYAIPRRIFRIPSEEQYFGKFTCPAPAITQVCHESRAVALRHGQFVPCQLPGTTSDDTTHNVWSWFSPDLDILLGTLIGGEPRHERVATTVFLEQLDEDEDIDEGEFSIVKDDIYEIAQLGHFPSLRTVYVGRRFDIGRGLSASAFTALFRGEPALLVDRYDDAEVARVLGILQAELRAGNPYTTARETSDPIIAELQEDVRDKWPEDAKALNKIFIECRARAREEADLPIGASDVASLFDESDQPDVSKDWIRKALEEFNMQPAIVFLPEKTPAAFPDWLDRY